MPQPFIHLRGRSAYSLLESALHVGDLAKQCVGHDMPAMALTDHNNLFGALEFSEKFSDSGVQPIVGLTLDLKGDAKGQIVLLSQTEAGYANLMRLSSAAFLEVEPSEEAHVSLERTLSHGEGLIALSGGGEGVLAELLQQGKIEAAEALAMTIARGFPNRFYIELHRHGIAIEHDTEEALINLAYKLGLPLVAANDIRFKARKDYRAHDALMCIAASSYRIARASRQNIISRAAQK
jgi:DNA polymerase-3 subunit alpha